MERKKRATKMQKDSDSDNVIKDDKRCKDSSKPPDDDLAVLSQTVPQMAILQTPVVIQFSPMKSCEDN